MGSETSAVYNHNTTWFGKLLANFFSDQRKFKLEYTLKEGKITGSFSELSDNLLQCSGIVGIICIKKIMRAKDLHLYPGYSKIVEEYLNSNSAQFNFSDGFSVDLPHLEGQHNSADLFWHLIISEKIVSNTLATVDISGVFDTTSHIRS